MVGKYTIWAQYTLFTQVVHIFNTFKVLQGSPMLIEKSVQDYATHNDPRTQQDIHQAT